MPVYYTIPECFQNIDNIIWFINTVMVVITFGQRKKYISVKFLLQNK